MDALNIIFTFAIVLFIAFTVATSLALAYYLVGSLVLKRDSGSLATSMSHLVYFGTILVLLAMILLYAQEQEIESLKITKYSEGYEAGYSSAVRDVNYIVDILAPESFEGISVLDYIGDNASNYDEFIDVVDVVDAHVHDSDTIFRALKVISGEELQEAVDRIKEEESK